MNRKSLLAAVYAVALPTVVHATDYRFVRVADTRDTSLLLDFARKPAINNAGSVAFYGLAPGSVPGFYSGNGGAASTIITGAAPDLADLAFYSPSYNDTGQVAFYADKATIDGFRIYRAEAGAATQIAISGSGTFGGFNQFVSVNNSGNVAFTVGGGSNSGLYIGAGGAPSRIYGNDGDGVAPLSGPSLNNVGSLSFAASYAPTGLAHLKGAGGTPDVIGSSINDISLYAESVINDSGMVVFGAYRFSAPTHGIFFGAGGSVIFPFVDTDGPYSDLPIVNGIGFGGNPSVNNAGTIVFAATLDAGGQGIFTGPDPTSSRVIQDGTTLFGRTFTSLYGGLGRESVNDAGEIVFQAQLLDGFGFSEAVVKAIPSFAMKWSDDSNGTWSDTGNWIGPVPDAFHHDANFTDVITEPRTVTVDGAFTVGSINFNNANRYTVSGAGFVTVDDSFQANINVLSGSHTIASNLNLPRRTLVNVASVSSTLTVSGATTFGNIELVKNGSGNLAMRNYRLSTLTINSGTANVLSNGTDSGVSRIGTVSFGGEELGGVGSALDLTDNDLIVTNQSLATVTGLLIVGRNGGSWDGNPGINSSTAASHPSGSTTLGILSGSEYEAIYGSGAAFGPFTVATSDVLVKYTWYGDTDFNGVVDFDDYVATDNGFNTGLSGWRNGDSNFDGFIDFDDYVLIDNAFNTQSGTLIDAINWLEGENRDPAMRSIESVGRVIQHYEQFGVEYANAFYASVPEPGAMLLIGAGYLPLARRRRDKMAV